MKGMKTGGRQVGTRNKRNQRIEEMAKLFEFDPFEILMKIAGGDWEGLGYDSSVYVKEDAKGGTTLGYTITPEMRLNAAKEACQYLYAKRREEEPEETQPLEALTIEEKRIFLAQAKDEIKKLEAALEEPKEE